MTKGTYPGQTLPAGFGAILRESSDEKLQIEVTSKGTVIKGERSEFKLTSEDPAEFPAVAAFEEKKYHVIPAQGQDDGWWGYSYFLCV